MLKKFCLPIALVLFVSTILAVTVSGRAALGAFRDRDTRDQSIAVDEPNIQNTAHRVGRMQLSIRNDGTFGAFADDPDLDAFTNEMILRCEFPKFSNTRYLYAGAFWIGAVIGRDTLVSVGADGWVRGQEFNPDRDELGEIERRSIINGDVDAISEEDIICVYFDTLRAGVEADEVSQRAHMPLNIQVTQSSYAWSYSYAEDIILFDFGIRNIGTQDIDSVYMGIYVDADIHHETMDGQVGAQDDLTGFVETVNAERNGCHYIDTVFIAWTADNDGDLNTDIPVPAVTATRIVRTPAAELDVSFNWWISNGDAARDFGPREKPYTGRWEEPFRRFEHGGMGTPSGDCNKYYTLRNREFDYDQVYTASIQMVDTLWMYPPQTYACEWSQGLDTRYLLSFGPFNIAPGNDLPISFAYVAGEGFHTNPGNLTNLCLDPNTYKSNLNFDDLTQNARWADWIYDNPGVDTDGDGIKGQVIFCDAAGDDSVFIKGDGVPDWTGAKPPDRPVIWVEPRVGALKVRFNGAMSETIKDVFSDTVDFEGYRVYIARDRRESSYSLLASYDIEDYNKRVGVTLENGSTEYRLIDPPFTLNDLQRLYGNSDPVWDPLKYTISSPFQGPFDSVFYFEKQDNNASIFGVSSGIRKRFPNQPYPSHTNPDSALANELTEDGYLKYFEYEYDITNLLPSVEYLVNVSAFDFGSPVSGLASLETSRILGSVAAYPMASVDAVAAEDLKAYVYPNPYRMDAEYQDFGFEGRASGGAKDRVRAIHFANLPSKCTIRIFSLDGDLVRELEHSVDAGDREAYPQASHHSWDLITRNTQLIVSGLYYWTVEDENGEVQIGKLAIIM